MNKVIFLTILLYCILLGAYIPCVHAEDQHRAFIKVGGYVDGKFANSHQAHSYSQSTLPNNNTTLPSIQRVNTSTGAQTRTHSRVDITAGVQYSENLKFGATIVTNSLVGSNDDDMGNYASQNFVFIESQYGKVQIGVAPAPGSTMRIDSGSIARGTGGIAGDWWRFIGMPTFNTAGMNASAANELVSGHQPIFILSPMLPYEAGFASGATNSLFIYDGNSQTNPQLNSNGQYNALYPNQQRRYYGYGLSNILNYYTPRVNGFQFGFGIAPDTGNAGGIANRNSNYLRDGAGNQIRINGQTNAFSGDVRNYVSLGLNYKEQFNNLGVALSATYETGKVEPISSPYGVNGACTMGNCINGYLGRQDLNAWSVGGKLLYMGFAIAGSYGSWGNSLQPVTNNAKDANGKYLYPSLVALDASGNEMSNYEKSGFYNYGISYGFGPINFSITRLHTNNMGNEVDATSYSSDFKVGSSKFVGLVPYIEYTQFAMKGRAIFLQSTNSSYTPEVNNGNIFNIGIRMIF